jgi:hypothetical protein
MTKPIEFRYQVRTTTLQGERALIVETEIPDNAPADIKERAQPQSNRQRWRHLPLRRAGDPAEPCRTPESHSPPPGHPGDRAARARLPRAAARVSPGRPWAGGRIMTPYRTGAPLYVQAGWAGVIPLPPRKRQIRCLSTPSKISCYRLKPAVTSINVQQESRW